MGNCKLYWPCYQNWNWQPDWKGCCRQFWRGSDFLFTTLETAPKDTHASKTASCLQTLFFSCLHLQKPFASGYVAAQIAIVKTFPSPPSASTSMQVGIKCLPFMNLSLSLSFLYLYLHLNASWPKMFTFHEWFNTPRTSVCIHCNYHPTNQTNASWLQMFAFHEHL